MSALEHGHQHRVHHAKDSDDDGEDRGAPAHGPRDAESLAGGHYFIGHHGTAFGEDFFDLLAELSYVLLGAVGDDADVNEVDLALVPRDLLKHLE